MARAIATTTTVDRAALVEFIQDRHRAVLVTTRADGSPQLSPVTAGFDDGAIVISTYPDRAKVANLPVPRGNGARAVRRVERTVGAGRRHGRGHRCTGVGGAARRLLPL
ncbi:MAG: pyridoxamine 5'-phosphate oxidase family protein [Acidimicrobiales bacterium]